jgi:hypothetical protein
MRATYLHGNAVSLPNDAIAKISRLSISNHTSFDTAEPTLLSKEISFLFPLIDESILLTI